MIDLDIIALVGPAGTGKSHRALIVAHKYKADAIIDDGILIKDGKIVAGYSAKKEKSKIMAVRRAIFVLPGHAEEVRQAIDKLQLARILILGTSENMVHKIAKLLRLPAVSKIIRIEDIASKKEMEKAHYYRTKEGKHIIPVPTIELKPHFSGYLIDPLQSFFKKSGTSRRKLGEKSIVRPIFSYYGKLIIDDSTIKGIIIRLAKEKEYVTKVGSIKVRHVKEGEEECGIEVYCEVGMQYGRKIPELIKQMQEKIKEAVEYMTGMLVQRVNIMVIDLTVTA